MVADHEENNPPIALKVREKTLGRREKNNTIK